MVTKNEIKAEVDKVPDERLDEVYRIVKTFSQDEPSSTKESLLVRLSRIKIEGPEDFAANIDLYLSGEKKID